jgi:hypothetical protein
VLCKHCHSSIGKSGNAAASKNDDGFKYLQNGFGKINAECDIIERKINERTGLIFIKYQYSSEELVEAIKRIDSFVGKMRSDLDGWDSINKLAQQTKQFFNIKAGEVYRRLESLHVMIERREPTWWEKVCYAFKVILSKLFPFISFLLLSGKSKPKEIAA